MGDALYCADTSGLVWLQRNFDRTVFSDVWAAIEDLIKGNRLFAPSQVLAEIERGSDSLAAWCRRYAHIFREPTEDVANIVGELGTRYPGFVKTLEADEEADPWVVAWAKYENDRFRGELFGGECVVISSEGSRVNHIAQVGQAEGITCVPLQDVFAREGWQFMRRAEEE